MPLDSGNVQFPKVQVSWFDHNHILQKQATFSGYFTVGRSPDNDFVITIPSVSRNHLEVRWENGNWWIEDLQSSNGTYVNQNLIEQRCLLELPAIVTLGNSQILLRIETTPSTPEHNERSPDHPTPPLQSISQFSSLSRSFSKDELKARLLAHEEDSNAGEYTRMVRSIIHEDRTKRGKSYKKTIWGLTFLLLFSISLVGYQYIALSKASTMAIDMFYDIKALEISLAQAEIKLEENEEILGLTLEMIIKERLNANQEKIRMEHQKMTAERKRVAQERQRLADMKNKYQQYVDEAKSFRIRFPTDTQYEEELIARVARGFGESELELPRSFIAEVKLYIEYWRNSSRLQRAINHLENNYYTHVIIDALEKEGLPLYFLYLPLQESNYDTNAIGPETRFGIAKGAWQLLATTAQDYGLNLGPLADVRQYDHLDERFIFERATHAGTKHLKHIYSTEAQASGMLVTASYNFGHTRVREMIKKMESNPRERNFWKFIQQNNLPKETYDYVFYIFSAAVIGEDPKYFGFDFKPPLAMYSKK
ncbi:MAG: FHA domain-containing protein [Candidatus Omnitrophica bacterium]|nr:FHA domain-containing protein [Candidatus Omnitrophota bacterium]MCP5251521.1 FHA domain-containing protein [Burkholderiales bacterium]